MRSVKDKERTEPASAPDPFKRVCAAFGCPELGTITSSNVGPAGECQWFCRFHFGETFDRWPEITRERRLFWDAYREEPKEAEEVTAEYISKVKEELKKFAMRVA